MIYESIETPTDLLPTGASLMYQEIGVMDYNIVFERTTKLSRKQRLLAERTVRAFESGQII